MQRNSYFIVGVFTGWIAIFGTALMKDKPATKAPPLAVAPFNAEAARVHRDTWAKHLGETREVINSISMKLTFIPPGEFMMGSKESAEEIVRSPLSPRQ